MFAEPPRTPYDLNFRLLGFPVRVHPFFWLGSALLGANALNSGIQYLLIWIAVVFVSILVHELGHALAFRRFGSDSRIILWMFGGLAVPYSSVGRRWKQIVVSPGGAACRFHSLRVGLWLDKLFALGFARQRASRSFISTAPCSHVNLIWGIFNLLPVIPLDGGQVSRELCEGEMARAGLADGLKISIGFAAAVALY